jgi:hypothetical protein
MARKRQEQEQEQPPEPVEKLNRKACAAKVVKDWMNDYATEGDTDMDALALRADELFRAGHKDAEPNVELAAWAVQVVLESLQELSIVVLEWHCGVSLNPDFNSKKPNGNRTNGGK